MEAQCIITLPDWVTARLAEWREPLSGTEAGMRLAIALAAENVSRGGGGPFGAVVADLDSGECISGGVNLVTASGLSLAHAEMVALSMAQRRVGDWHLSRRRPLTLFTSCEPCAMCYGAVPWSGVCALVCGASQADAEAAGFDEGEKPAAWQAALETRGITVHTGVLRDAAVAVFDQYRAAGGEIYNPGEENQ